MQVDFDPIALEAVQLDFPCHFCATKTTSDKILVPVPDLGAEYASDSYRDSESAANCPNCKESFAITVWAGQTGGYIEIDELPEGSDVNVTEYPEPIEE